MCDRDVLECQLDSVLFIRVSANLLEENVDMFSINGEFFLIRLPFQLDFWWQHLLVNTYILLVGMIFTFAFCSVIVYYGGTIFYINEMLRELIKEFRGIRCSDGDQTLKQQLVNAVNAHRTILECVYH